MRIFVVGYASQAEAALVALATAAFVAVVATPALAHFSISTPAWTTTALPELVPTRTLGRSMPSAADRDGGAGSVPWTVFEKQTSAHQQVFSRAFNGSAWVTKGHGTVGGRSSASPKFAASLNFDQTRDGEAPAIDFAGAGRTVPWATWYEDNTSPFGHEEIFASRFDATHDIWVFAGQGRPGHRSDPPSLNIRTNKDAENPSSRGRQRRRRSDEARSLDHLDGGRPDNDQIFVVKPIGPNTTVCPPGTKPSGGAPWAASAGSRSGSSARRSVIPTNRR